MKFLRISLDIFLCNSFNIFFRDFFSDITRIHSEIHSLDLLGFFLKISYRISSLDSFRGISRHSIIDSSFPGFLVSRVISETASGIPSGLRLVFFYFKYFFRYFFRFPSLLPPQIGNFIF